MTANRALPLFCHSVSLLVSQIEGQKKSCARITVLVRRFTNLSRQFFLRTFSNILLRESTFAFYSIFSFFLGVAPSPIHVYTFLCVYVQIVKHSKSQSLSHIVTHTHTESHRHRYARIYIFTRLMVRNMSLFLLFL